MTRIEELPNELADDLLNDEQARELQGLLAQSKQAREVHIRMLQIEAGLRARRENLDLVPAIMARLRARMAESITQGVMSEIKAQPIPKRRRHGALPGASARLVSKVLRFPPFFRRGTWLPKPGLVAFAACVVLVAGVGFWMFGPTVGEPVLVDVKGMGLSLERGGQPLPAVAGIHLQSGDVLSTPENVTAIIGFAPESTRVTMQPGTELTLAEMPHSKRFALRVGKLEASVARQRPFRPMLITTPQAEARVVGTRFTLLVTTNATRLDVTEGKVKFTRKSDDVSVKVSAGHYAVAAANCELAALPFTGTILREWWSGVRGQAVNDLRADPRYPDHPDRQDMARTFELEPMKTNQLGVRFCGYVHPPVTGDYEFWLAGATAAALFMSPSENPAEEVPIAQVVDNSRKLDRPRFQGPSPWAPPVPLMAGRRYYIEALVFIEKGEGHLSVAWKRPGASRELLTGEYLSPFKPK